MGVRRQSSDDEAGDADLVRLAQGGSTAAFTSLYRRHVPRVYAYAMRRLGAPELAEDATQIVFMRVATSLAGCRDPNAFGGWLIAIARNVVADIARAQGPARSLDQALEAEDLDPSPEEWAIGREQQAELLALRERCLSARDRELFDLVLADLNDKEIAKVLGRSHGAVRTALWRLMIRLRECLGRQRPEEGGRDVAP